MIGTKRFLADGKRAQIKRFGVGITADVLVEIAELVERDGNALIVGAEALLADGERALKKGLGLCVAAEFREQPAEAIECGATSVWLGPRAFSRIARARR